jgi:flagellar biosynthesis protein FliQ
MPIRFMRALVVSALVLTTLPSIVWAHGEEVAVSPSRAAAGDVITVTGKGFKAGTQVSIAFKGDAHALGYVHIARDGSFTFQATVPADLAPGPRAIVVKAGNEEVSAPFEVLPAVAARVGREEQTPPAVGSAAEGPAHAAEPAAAAAARPASVQPPTGMGGTLLGEPATVVSSGLIAIIPSISEAAEALVEGTIAALLPILWLLVLALHLARPYMLQNLEKFTLRLGADLWWLLYRGIRDLLIVITFMLSSIFFLPHVTEMVKLPVTGPFAAVALFGVLVVKLMRDSDDDYATFVLESSLLGVGAALYLIGFLLGPALSWITDEGLLGNVSQMLTSTTNLQVAVTASYMSLAAVTVLGLFAVYYNLRLAASRPASGT